MLDNIRFCWSYARPWRLAIVLGMLAVMAEAALENLPPLLTRMLIDDVLAAKKGWGAALPILGAVAAVVVGIAATGWLHVRLLYASSIRVVAAIREAVYEKLQRLSLSYHEEHASGDLLARLMEDVDLADDLISRLADELMVSGTGLLVALGLMVWLSGPLTGAALLPVPLLLVLTWGFTTRIRGLYRRVRDAKGAMYGRAGEALGGVLTVKAFSRGDHELARFRGLHERYNDARLESVGTWGRWMPAIHLARNSGLVLVLAWGTWMLLGGRSGMTLGVLVAFVMYVQFFYQPFGELFGLYDRVLKAGAAMERVREVLAAPLEVADAPDAVALPPLRGDVRFESVSFRYRTGEEVLRDLSLDIAAGETVALVGSSGAGKTSLVSLVARFHDPTSGVVRLDGHDLRSVRQADLRSQIGVVNQETFLFNDTVRENLIYGRPEATFAEIEEAVRVARADGFIGRLPQGYDTVIGERGVRLSAGQKQRLSLARALLARPRVLILDEPTSMLDAESERHIEASMEDLRRGRTTLVIAHRLSTVRRADRILVIEDGRIAEMGTHDRLMSLGGRYRELYDLQFRGDATASEV